MLKPSVVVYLCDSVYMTIKFQWCVIICCTLLIKDKIMEIVIKLWKFSNDLLPKN